MKYYVTMRVNGRFNCEVKAKNIGDAMKKADNMYVKADFGELEDVESQTEDDVFSEVGKTLNRRGNEVMVYSVAMKVDGRFACEVEAENFEGVKKKASEAFSEADFGVLECIDADFVNAYDADGICHDFD